MSTTTRRPDHRAPTDLRPLHISFDGLARVDGSARFGFGHTIALASVSGPIEARLATEQPSKATFDVFIRPLGGISGTEAKAQSSALRTLLTPSLILTQNPRTLVQLVAQSLSPALPSSSFRPRLNPSLNAAIVNASTLCLLQAASIPMRGVICAVGVGRINGSLVLDPEDEEADVADGGGAFAFFLNRSANASSDLVWTDYTARAFTQEEFRRAEAMAREGADQVWRAMKDAVSATLGGHGMLTSQGSISAVRTDEDDDQMLI